MDRQETERKKKKKMPTLLWEILALCLVLGILAYQYNFVEKQTYTYETTDAVVDNPMMGFVANADYPELAETTSMVYLPVVWREFEPREGYYDFEYLREQYNLNRWSAMGKQVVLRFICDIPGDEKHMDIPDWLYEKTGDGAFYDCDYGKGYSPDYGNKTFIEYHKKAIEALGEEWGDGSFVCFVELGSLGHWGEWHVKYDAGIPRLPSEEVCFEYVEPYLAAFPNAKLLMRRPYTYVAENNLGVYNDMTGHKESTEEWLAWMAEGGAFDESESPLTYSAVENIWETGVVGGEFTSSLTMDEMLGANLERTLELIQQSHMTFIGPKIPDLEEQAGHRKGTEKVKEAMGYRYGLSRSVVQYDTFRKRLKVEVTMKSFGVAPMYFDWPVYIYVMDKNGNVIKKQQINIKLSELQTGEAFTAVARIDCRSENLEEMPLVGIGIENPYTEQPAVNLDMKANCSEKIYFLTK